MAIYQVNDRIIQPGEYPWGYPPLCYALDFSGDAYVSLADHATFADSNFSISFWFYAHSINFNNDTLISFRKNNDIQIRFSGDSLEANSYGGDHSYLSSSVPTSIETWYHVVMMRDGSEARMYVNGVLTDTGGVSTPTTNVDQTDTLGGRHDSGNLDRPFDGMLDDVRVYSDALSTEEILALFKRKIYPVVKSSSLLSWYPMNEGKGNTAYDTSGNGKHGTIHYATWVKI